MRRFLALPLAVALLVCCLGCNNSSPTAPDDPPMRLNLQVAIENNVTQARIPGVAVTVQERGHNRDFLIREQMTSTGADGTFRLDDLQPGWIYVVLSKPGFRSETIEITEIAGDRFRTLGLFSQ